MNELEPCLMLLKSSEFINNQCKKCRKNFLYGETISMYQSDFYHTDCFRCENCQNSLIDQGFFRQDDGCLYCLNCHIDFGNHCQKCRKPLLPGEIFCQFDGKFFHYTCFLCDICQNRIDRKYFSYENNRILCENCLNK